MDRRSTHPPGGVRLDRTPSHRVTLLRIRHRWCTGLPLLLLAAVLAGVVGTAQHLGVARLVAAAAGLGCDVVCGQVRGVVGLDSPARAPVAVLLAVGIDGGG